MTLRDGLGEGLEFSVTVAGEERGDALGPVLGRVWSCVLVVRRCVSLLGGDSVIVRPGVVTVSDATVVVVVVVVVCCS